MKKKIIIFILTLLITFQIPCMIWIWYPYQVKKDFDIKLIPVAARDLAYREKIATNDLKWVEIPSSLITDEMIINENELVNHLVSNEIQLVEGSFFVDGFIDDPDLIKDQPVLMLKQNQTAYPLNVDLIQIAGNTLIENQIVDIYCMIAERNEIPVIDKLFESIRIIDLKDRKGLDLDHEQSIGVASVITIAINEEYIPLLSTALQIGTLQLYANEDSWDDKKECRLYEDSKIIPLLAENNSSE